MKAIVHKKYGSPSELEFLEVEKPTPKANEVLIKVHASSINSWDYDLVTGIPRIYRLIFGLFKPKNKVIGIDVAGIVVAKGDDVKNHDLWKILDAITKNAPVRIEWVRGHDGHPMNERADELTREIFREKTGKELTNFKTKYQ